MNVEDLGVQHQSRAQESFKERHILRFTRGFDSFVAPELYHKLMAQLNKDK